MLDTSIAIPLRDGDEVVRRRLHARNETTVMSILTRVELEGGVHRDPAQAQARRARLDKLFTAIAVMPFDEACADAYARIVEQAGYSRRKLIDRMTAAQALVHNATLVTLNPGDLADVAGLAIEDWS